MEPSGDSLCRIATIGTGLCVLGTGAAAYCTTLTTFTLCFGLMFGLGAGFSYMVPFLTSWGHYPEHKARVTGLLMAAFGYSTSIFNLLTTYIVNPDNLTATVQEVQGEVVSYYFTEEVALRTPTMMLWLAGIFLLLSVCGILSISEKTGNAGQGTEQDKALVKEGLSSVRFWSLFIASFLSVALSMYISAAYKTYGNELFSDDKYLALVGSVSALLNGSSRFLWAEVIQKYSFRSVYIVLLVTQIIISATLYSFARTQVLFMFYICLIFINQGCHFVLFPAVLGKMYGRSAGSALYAVLYIGLGLSALAGFFLHKYTIQSIGYSNIFLILTVAAVLSLILAVLFEERSLDPEGKANQNMEPLISSSKASLSTNA